MVGAGDGGCSWEDAAPALGHALVGDAANRLVAALSDLLDFQAEAERAGACSVMRILSPHTLAWAAG